MNLSKEIKITNCGEGLSANTSAIEGTVLDMQGYDGVMFITGIATANAGNHIKVQQGTDDSVSDAADLEDSQVAAGEDGDQVWVDVYKPQERYVRAYVTRTASRQVGYIYAIQYKGIKRPEDNEGTGFVGQFLNSPDEGTA